VVPGHVGLGLNQAFYWGLPAITEKGLQPPEIQYLKPGRNGFMVGENDLAELKEKMLLPAGQRCGACGILAQRAREDILQGRIHRRDVFGLSQSCRVCLPGRRRLRRRNVVAWNQWRTDKIFMANLYFGMGYVGVSPGACFAEMGHTVLGVEPNPVKVDLINGGKSPIIEKDLDALITRAGPEWISFRATGDWEQAIKDSELALVWWARRAAANGSIDLRYVQRVCEPNRHRPGKTCGALHRGHSQHGDAWYDGQSRHPRPREASGRKVGRDFGLCMHPEFLREGTSIHDFYNPPKTVIGQYDEESGQALAGLYKEFPGQSSAPN